jgi:UDP-N-acetylmuramoyl-L-alanyl-D-glutamate--2,6-diaminopimelate ligase
MQLSELLRAAGVEAERRGGDPEISDLAYDSREVQEGTLFFCFPGERSDGHDFAATAAAQGAAALLVERPLEVELPQARVADARAAMAPVAAAFWGDPTSELRVVGVTGTNGKTTTCFLVRHLLEASGISCGLLGTVKQVVGGREQEVVRTTPEAIDLQRTFARMLESGDRACAMEVSSHALALHRADAIHFEVKAFTNLTQDHLDFHADMEEYFEAKRLLFSAEGGSPIIELEGGISAINLDDRYGRRLVEELSIAEEALVTFSAGGDAEADFRVREASSDAGGSSFVCESPAGELEVTLPLPGAFNIENALAALASADALGLDLNACAAAFGSAGQVPGRFESIDEGQPFAVIVDYAHTPDSLRNVLDAARRLTAGRLIAIFGCGGDRDREKRPLMGAAGAELSDLCVVTSDNPRSEEPRAIVEQILGGIEGNPSARAELLVEVDRRAAIAAGLERAAAGDAVVIAGKGHEQGQEFEAGRKVPFDDRVVAREELQRLTAANAR